MARKIGDLIRITQMSLDVELAKLRKLQESMDEIYAEISDLKHAEQHRLAALKTQGKADLAFSSGADEKWWKWRQVQLARLNTKLAALRAQRDIQTTAAKTAFGKNQVVQAIAHKVN